MAAYPNTGYTARILPSDDGRETLRSTDGTPRIRDYHATQWFDAIITHPCCTEAERDTILSFYDTNKDIWNTFSDVADATPQSYTMLMTGRPAAIHKAGLYWQVTSYWIGKYT